MNTHRPVYTHAQLKRLFDPQSVAIFGASPNTQSFGARTIANMAHYRGQIFRINPNYQQIGEDTYYPNLASLPVTPDCAIFAIPRAGIEPALLECVKAGIGGAVIFASGYTETGDAEHTKSQQRISAIARESGIKIIGPNCLGFINFISGAMTSFASGEMIMNQPRGPGIGVVSQSGALGFSLGQAERRGINLSHVLTFGNGADVNIADEIAFLAGDPNCAAIACLFEGMQNPKQLLEAGDLAWKANKPVVICKLGIGKDAATAALSHTGSLAGSTEAYWALFERAGFIVVPHIENLLETASFFAKVGTLKSTGVAAIGGSGGALIAATDAAEKYGVPMPQPTEATKVKLRPFVPEYGALRNPCDLTAMLTKDNSIAGNAIEAMITGDTYGAIVVPHTSLSQGSIKRAQGMSAAGQRLGKPVCLTYSGGWINGPGVTEAELDPNLQCFQSIDRCYATLAAWHKREARRSAEQSAKPRLHHRISSIDAATDASQRIKASLTTSIGERQSKSILALYGIPVTEDCLTHSADEAAIAAQACGFPVVLKIESSDIQHKTEVGGIRLNLNSTDAVMTAYAEMMVQVKSAAPNAKIDGVLVQAMQKPGLEIMVGVRIDPLFGPLVIVGLGGIFVELLKDTALELAPVTTEQALNMLNTLKGHTLFKGYRGADSVDLSALADIIVRLSEFANDQQQIISELDVNPIICSADGLIAVDALIVRH